MKTKSILCCLLASGIATLHATQPSGTLPVIYLDTEDGVEITGKDQGYVNATYWLEPNGSDFEAIGSKESPAVTEIKARGNYTWNGFDKKPYKLKLDKKTTLLGMDKSKHFALLAHADDNMGFMRNALGFELARRMGLAWTPEMVPVEYVHNGDYKGLYFATQTIRVDKSRVNITEMADYEEDPVNASDPAQASGGWIVEIDNYDADPHITVMEHWRDEWGNQYPIWFTYDKSMDNASPEQLDYLTKSLSRINDLIYAEDKENSTELESMLDFESLARFYLVQELMDNHESFHGSCYMFRERGEDTKWNFGPVWDFGSSFQRGNHDGHFYDGAIFHNVWIEELAKFPAFQRDVESVWADFCENHYVGIPEYLDNFVETISGAAPADLERWPQYGNDNLQSKKENIINLLRNRVRVLAKLYGTAPVEPLDIYVRGELNGWTELTHKMIYQNNGTYTIHLDQLNGEFKIASEDWKTVDYGAPKNDAPMLKLHETFGLEHQGANIKIANDEILKNVDMTFDPVNETLLVTDPSGIVDITAAHKAYSLDGNALTAHARATIHTIDGRTVAKLAAGSSTILQPGLYIVHTDKSTVKVVVR